MSYINTAYLDLPGSYLFTEVARRVREYQAKNPQTHLIRLGIGDVTKPLPSSVITALHKAVDQQATAHGFHGYGPEQGYPFLREAIVRDSFAGLDIEADEIFISDGAKCDIGNFQELFSTRCRIAVTDPVYPVYVDSNVMTGRAGAMNKNGQFSNLIYLPCTAENGYIPDLPPAGRKQRPHIIYLCYPNNPTGTVLTKEQLTSWVRYAQENESLILFDAAYEAFIRTPDIPHSIYEIEGAHEVAVEFRSYSKSAGFTGLRCGFAVVPKRLQGRIAACAEEKNHLCSKAREGCVSLHSLWMRRQTTKYNGCPYIVQRAAEAVHTPWGKKETGAIINGYLTEAGKIRQAFTKLGFHVAGGVDAPYVWVTLPKGTNSWAFFDALLQGAGIVGTPGAGFGPSGEGCFRLTGFGAPSDVNKALERLESWQF